eukprot:2870011-Alexandrium_andersonii.AAC.1
MLNASTDRVDVFQAAWTPFNINTCCDRGCVLVCGDHAHGEGLLRGEGSLTAGAVVLRALRVGLGLLSLVVGLGAVRPPHCQTRASMAGLALATI